MLIGVIVNKFKGLVAAVALMASVLVPGTAQAAPLVVPKTSWGVCSETKVTYCIESATIQSIGSVAEPLVWVASGSPEASAGVAAAAPTVVTVAGEGNRQTAEIHFGSIGTKRLLVKVAPIEKL